MDLEAIENYLLRSEYPEGFTKAEKANLRRKCRNNFRIDDGILQYKTARKGGEEGEEAETATWKVCVRTEAEKKRVLESCHAGLGGML